jgi:predicted AAA+ superfamily ATPase
MNKETLKYVMRQFVDRKHPKVYRRDLSIPTDSGKVISLIGPRRTGKTFLMFQIVGDLLSSGVEREQVIYLNLEDDRLFPVGVEDLDLILKAHLELFPESANKKRYLFFDEVQNVEGWERYIRRIHDTEDVSIFLTGSSAALLQRDMSTAMRGRSVTYEVFPLSFSEFLSFKGIKYVPYSDESEAVVMHAFQEYMEWGGFPEVVLAEEPLKMKILQEYASIMLHRDLVERYSGRNERMMRLLLKFCAEHTGSLISINKLYNDFKSQGLRLGKATLYDYMTMLEDSFIVFGAAKYDPSSRRQLQASQKIHLIDPGLGKVYRTGLGRDIGHRFESLIYLHERRQQRDICYYRNGFELDMCWGNGAVFVNAVWDMNDYSTQERELRAMQRGIEMWPAAKGYLVYGVGGDVAVPAGIDVVEGWRYLLLRD